MPVEATFGLGRHACRIDQHLLPNHVASDGTPSDTVYTPSEILKRAFDNEILVADEKAIREDPNFREIEDPTERESVLIRYFSSARIALYFEQTYESIFRSQIEALEYLNSPGDKIVENLRNWYIFKTNPKEIPFGIEEFDQWLDFLKNRNFVEIHDNNIDITSFGREFLKYLIGRGYSSNRKAF